MKGEVGGGGRGAVLQGGARVFLHVPACSTSLPMPPPPHLTSSPTEPRPSPHLPPPPFEQTRPSVTDAPAGRPGPLSTGPLRFVEFDPAAAAVQGPPAGAALVEAALLQHRRLHAEPPPTPAAVAGGWHWQGGDPGWRRAAVMAREAGGGPWGAGGRSSH
jgi:hypothetical protein